MLIVRAAKLSGRLSIAPLVSIEAPLITPVGDVLAPAGSPLHNLLPQKGSRASS